jgi:hypothetical protein
MSPAQGSTWSEEEDGLLAHWQQVLGNKWADIARHIPGRSGQQCAQRWVAARHPPGCRRLRSGGC